MPTGARGPRCGGSLPRACGTRGSPRSAGRSSSTRPPSPCRRGARWCSPPATGLFRRRAASPPLPARASLCAWRRTAPACPLCSSGTPPYAPG
eukprot:15435874-Alexandrium_andersonii.AAC.1